MSGLPPPRHLASNALHTWSRSRACSTSRSQPDFVNEPVSPSDRCMTGLPFPDTTNEFQLALYSARRTSNINCYLVYRVPIHTQKCNPSQFLVCQHLQKSLALLSHL